MYAYIISNLNASNLYSKFYASSEPQGVPYTMPNN